jgi:hypothetical protein
MLNAGADDVILKVSWLVLGPTQDNPSAFRVTTKLK